MPDQPDAPSSTFGDASNDRAQAPTTDSDDLGGTTRFGWQLQSAMSLRHALSVASAQALKQARAAFLTPVAPHYQPRLFNRYVSRRLALPGFPH